MEEKSNILKRNLSILLCSLSCFSTCSSILTTTRIQRDSIAHTHYKKLDKVIQETSLQNVSSNNIKSVPKMKRDVSMFRPILGVDNQPNAFGYRQLLFNRGKQSLDVKIQNKLTCVFEDYPLTTLATLAGGTSLVFRYGLYPIGSGVQNLYYWLTNSSIRTLANYIGHPVKLVLKVADKKIKFKDLEALGKDLKEHKGWVHDIKNLKTLLKLWSIKVDFKEDNTIVAAGKTIGSYVIYPFEQGTGVSRDNTNVMKRWKGNNNDPNYPILMHGGCLDKPYSIENAMWQWAADKANRTGKYIDRLISTEAIAMLTLNCFLVNDGWANADFSKRADAAGADGNPGGGCKGTYVTYIRNDKTPSVPYAFEESFGHGSSDIKSFGGKKTVDGSDFDSSGVVFANNKSFFIKIPNTLSTLPAGAVNNPGALVASNDYVKTRLDFYAEKKGGKVVSRENAGLQFLNELKGAIGANVFVVTFG